jgi:hypothetical protein
MGFSVKLSSVLPTESGPPFRNNAKEWGTHFYNLCRQLKDGPPAPGIVLIEDKQKAEMKVRQIA